MPRLPDPRLTFRSAFAGALILAIGTAAPAFAQSADSAAEAPPAGAGLPLGEEVSDSGSSYVADTFGDWTKLCERAGEGGEDPCGLVQLLEDAEGNPLAEMTIVQLPPGGEAVAAATVLTPLGTVLPQQITMRVDDGTPRRYPFLFCDVSGCYARFGLTAAVVESFRRGTAGTLTISSMMAPDQPIDLTISLSGFTAGYGTLSPAN
jgi:invasion protein IalB